MQTSLFVRRPVQRVAAAIVIGAAIATGAAWQAGALQNPDQNYGALPSLAGTIERVTPAVVNIRVERSTKADMPAESREFMRRFFGDPRPLARKMARLAPGRRRGLGVRHLARWPYRHQPPCRGRCAEDRRHLP